MSSIYDGDLQKIQDYIELISKDPPNDYVGIIYWYVVYAFVCRQHKILDYLINKGDKVFVPHLCTKIIYRTLWEESLPKIILKKVLDEELIFYYMPSISRSIRSILMDEISMNKPTTLFHQMKNLHEICSNNDEFFDKGRDIDEKHIRLFQIVGAKCTARNYKKSIKLIRNKFKLNSDITGVISLFVGDEPIRSRRRLSQNLMTDINLDRFLRKHII